MRQIYCSAAAGSHANPRPKFEASCRQSRGTITGHFVSVEFMGKLAVKQTLVGVLVAGVGCISIIALILTVVQHEEVNLPSSKYGIVFDAGSSHTTLFLYQWPREKENSTGVVSQVLFCDVDGPGISGYAQDPPGAGQSLKKCLDVAKGAVPPGQWGETPVALGATAGMRLLNLQNSIQANQVMEEVKKTMQGYPFDFRGAKILSGMEEGAYGWITINYLLDGFIKYSFQGKWLHPVGAKTQGALDLGGASTQITFQPKESIQDPQTAAHFRLYGVDYDVYTHSYLCYGKDQVMRQLQAELHKAGGPNYSSIRGRIIHPCYHDGFELKMTLGDLYSSPCINRTAEIDLSASVTFSGNSNPDQCLALIKKIFNFTQCNFYPHCSFNGIYQPPVDGIFFAFSAYFYTFNILGLTPQAKVEQANNTIDSFCRKNWKMVKTEHPTEKDKHLQDYCGSAVYITTLLLDGYKFKSWDNIYFQKKAADADIGWTLGYMLNLTNLISSEAPVVVKGVQSEQWTAGVFFIVFAIFLSCLILLVLFAWNPNY
ncbi:ectonucleoside triphosphate diphosphohydrolase 8 isoform X1 [Arapaima gigas]